MATILFNKIYPKGSLVKNITVGSTEVKFVKRGDGILFYDILKSDVYNPPTITLNYSTNTSPAKGGTLSPSLSYSQSWYRIGYSGKTYSQTNKTSGASSITYSISGTGASINSSTGVVTWASRGTTTGEKRQATVTVTVTINGEQNTATATVYQEANVRTLASVYLSPYQPDSTWIVTVTNGNWNTCPAGGGYVKARGYANYTHTSGSPLNDQKITDDASLTWSDSSWLENHTNGGYHIKSRGTSYTTSTRSTNATWSYTYNGVTKTSAAKTLTQAKNVITSVSVTSTPGSLTGSSFAAEGGTNVTTSGSASASAKLIFSSGGSITTNYNTTTYGTWTFHGYTWSSSQSYATVNGASAWNSLSVTMSNNMTTSTRSATITRKEKGFTFTLNSSYNNGATSGTSTGTQCTCTVSQAKGTKVYGDYTGTLSLSNTGTISAAADSRTVTFGKVYRPWTWNGVANSGGNDYYSGTIYLTLGVNTGSSYCSLNTTSATNSSSSTSSSTLSKSSYGTTPISAQTYTIYLRIGSTSGTIAKQVSISTTANAISSYKSFTVSVSYSNIGPLASASTVKPTVSGTVVPVYTSGSPGSAISTTVTVTSAVFTTQGNASSVTSAGVITWPANKGVTSDRSCTVTLGFKASHGNLTTSKTGVTSKCLKDYITTYDNYSDLSGGSFSYSNAGINGGTITPSHTKATQTKRAVWKSGYTQTVNATVTSTFSFLSTYNYVSFNNTSTGAITWTSGVHYNGNRYTQVMCTWSGEGSKSKQSGYVTATQICDSQETSYSWKQQPILSVATAGADSNMSNLPVTCSATQVKTIKWKSDGVVVSTSDVSVSPSVSNLKATTNTSYISYISGNKLSWYPNTTVNTRSVTITATVTANGISTQNAIGTAKQNGVPSTTYYITVKMVNNTQAGTSIIVPYSTNMANASSGTYTLSAAMEGSKTTTLTIKVPNSVTFQNLVRFGVSTQQGVARKTATSSTGTTTQCTISNKLYTSQATSKQNVATIYINY